MFLFSTNFALYSTCMCDKVHFEMLRDRIAFPFLFSFFSFFFYFINTQNCPLRNVSFGYTLYRTVDRKFANVILNIVKQKGII